MDLPQAVEDVTLADPGATYLIGNLPIIQSNVARGWRNSSRNRRKGADGSKMHRIESHSDLWIIL